MKPLAVLVGMALTSCGSGTSEQLQLLLADAPIELEAPTKILVQIVVVGAADGDVMVSSPNLPGFATLAGETITLSPAYGDAGDYAIHLIAQRGRETATGTMHLHITRMNTGPMWLPVPYFSSGNGDRAPYANILAPVCDKEGDNFTFEISVAPIDQPLPDTPDFTHFVDFTVTPPLPYEKDTSCAEFTVDLPGLATGDYHGAVHARDVLGAEDPYGWVELGGVFHVTNGP